MELSDIRKLVKLVETSEVHELEFEQDGAKIRIRKAEPQVVPVTQLVEAAVPVAQAAAAAPVAAPEAAAPAESSTNYHEVKSPMVGTFYRAPAPDADPYVKEGDKINPGQVLCIVEAMKLMNEIESEVSGRIVEIMVDNAQPVEFGQVLFRIDLNG